MMECYFCGNEIPKGTGLIRVLKNGTTFSFCSRKCKVNSIDNKREGHKKKWTLNYKRKKEEENRQKNKKLAKK